MALDPGARNETPGGSWLSPKTRVRPSSIQRRGLFAVEAIRRGEIVAVKGGEVFDRSELAEISKSLGPAEIQVTDDLFIGPRRLEDRDRTMIFSNHSCEPNLGVRGQIVFVALRDVAPGEELTHDWAMTDDDDYRMECRCGSAACRKVVTGQDWRRPDLQRKYGEFMSWYLRERSPAKRKPRRRFLGPGSRIASHDFSGSFVNSAVDPARELLRHAVATVAYRGEKAVRGAPVSFSQFRIAEGTRTPGEILAHIGDLFDWAFSLAGGVHVWKETPPGAWDRDVDRFFQSLKRFDEALASDRPLGYTAERLMQGPVADALAHVGQIAMLRRISGAPVRGESYFKADIVAGRVGADQSPPRLEFE